MTNLVNSNKSFYRMIRLIRKIMPTLSAILLISVYIVSAAAGGLFLSRLMADLPGGMILAYAIGAAIQATRATLVFFAQLNPNRPSFTNIGELVAVIMGLISIAEILSLVAGAGLPYPVAISLSILMAAGVGIELYLLKEIKFATELELFNNKAYWSELQSFYKARKDFKLYLERVKDLDNVHQGQTAIDALEPPKNGTAKHLGNGQAKKNGVHPL